MIERRETARRRVCLGGRLRVSLFLPEIECALRDVSLGGARIRLDPGATLPAVVDLIVPCRAETRRARVLWRDGATAGLSFALASPAPAPGVDPGGDILNRLADAETEVVRLRAALALAGGGERPPRVH